MPRVSTIEPINPPWIPDFDRNEAGIETTLAHPITQQPESYAGVLYSLRKVHGSGLMALG